MSVGSESMAELEFKRRISKAWHHLRSGRKDLQRVLEREKLRMGPVAILILLPILTVKFIELLLWIRHYGKGLTYTN